MASPGLAFASFMASPAGRLLRIAAGLAIIYCGWAMHSGTGKILMLAGLVPIAAGVFNFCLIAPLINAPFWGRQRGP